MKASFSRLTRGTLCTALLLSLPLIASAEDGATPLIDAATPLIDAATPLIDKVRNATMRYIDINVALREGFVVATPPVNGPDTGARGVYLVHPARVGAGVLNAEQPEALIYEPMANGGMRFVGVVFIVLESAWAAKNPPGSVPALEGNRLYYFGAPNRYGLPGFYAIHVWAWWSRTRNVEQTVAWADREH
jgi:hypothetical protein